MQVKRELEEERQVAEEEARRAQQAIEAKQAELAQIEAARKQEVRLTLLTISPLLGYVFSISMALRLHANARCASDSLQLVLTAEKTGS